MNPYSEIYAIVMAISKLISRVPTRWQRCPSAYAILGSFFAFVSINLVSTSSAHQRDMSEDCDMVHLTEEVFGVYNNETVKKFTWSSCGFSISAISYGAIIQAIKLPDKHGVLDDIVLGFGDIDSYVTRNSPYFGAAVGRCANRIAKARFNIDGIEYQLFKNAGDNHLHGGKVGFDKVNWKTTVEGTKVHFSYYSKDGEENYPGDLVTTVTYELKSDLSFHMEFISTTTKKTVVNLTNHSYFNLAGHATGADELYDHIVAINADQITETDSESIPTGRFVNVGGTPYDLRLATKVGDMISTSKSLYDDNFCVNQRGKKDLTWVSRLSHPSSGRYLEIHSNQPGVQFYTANGLPAPGDEALVGKDGASYQRHGALCLETQNYPDAVNHENFPNAILAPGEVYNHTVVYSFGVQQ